MNTWILSTTLLFTLLFGPAPGSQGELDRVAKLLQRYLANPTNAARLELSKTPLETLEATLPKALSWRSASKIQKQGKVVIGDTFYLYQLPENYTTDRAWPLMVSLHGNPPRHYKRVHYEYWKGDPAKAGYILVSPDLEGGRWHRVGDPVVLAALRDASTRFRVDPDRIYVNGYSSGGSGAWIMGTRYADVFAGMIVRCGIRRPNDHELTNLRDHGVYIIHATLDHACPVDQARRAVKTLEHLNITHHYKEFPRGHDFYPRTNLEILKYMEDYKLAPRSAFEIYARFDEDRPITEFVSLSGKFHHLQGTWEGNQVNITVDKVESIQHLDVYLRKDLLSDAKTLRFIVNGKDLGEVAVQRDSWSFLKALELSPFVNDGTDDRLFVGSVRLVDDGVVLDQPVQSPREN